ncbi:exostosin domain-containing protein [Scytonema sp. PCC 10023]|uniref:exostosin domain-containing protein n=1 Tax=Scytonema sp. PCC 10023 TaxID=1680591 RepID=UPI0039C5D4CD
MKIKIFSDIQYLPAGKRPVHLLEPFWLGQIGENLPFWEKGLINYANLSHSLFEISSLEEADIAVFPCDWIHVSGNTWKDKANKSLYTLAIQFAQMVQQAGKPIAIFYCGDRSHEQVPIQDAFVFRQSLIASKRRPNDFVFTAFYEDLVEFYLGNELTIRQKQEKPVVGFDGCADPGSSTTRLKDLISQGVMLARGKEFFSPYEGHRLRYEALKYLSNSPLVEPNFKIRDNMVFYDDANNPDKKQKLRLEYVHNMVESDYILCSRGRGNFSLRVIETLCCGRIPIIVDTGCVLPYDFKVDWKKYSVWVDKKDLPQIAEKVADFHKNLSSQEFIELQYECRHLWKEWLSYEGFFTNFWQHFQINTSKKEAAYISPP